MIKSIGLFYFSGTGNTQVVAALLKEAFERRGVDVTTTRIEQALKEKAGFDPDAYDLVGVGHPVHGFDAPRILYDFIADLIAPSPAVEKKRAFIFKTAGDFSSMNNAASKTAIECLERKGYDVFYDRIICMPSNWAVKYDDAFSKQLYCAAVAKMAHMVDDILAGRERSLKVGPILRWGVRLLSQGEDWGLAKGCALQMPASIAASASRIVRPATSAARAVGSRSGAIACGACAASMLAQNRRSRRASPNSACLRTVTTSRPSSGTQASRGISSRRRPRDSSGVSVSTCATRSYRCGFSWHVKSYAARQCKASFHTRRLRFPGVLLICSQCGDRV